MIVGAAGHVDHGKTSLVKALTGVDTDRLREEKERGLTIDLGFAYLPLDDGETIGFVDAPGHEKFIHNMLAGATTIDFVLLVVAADDGVMPQTREHLEILDLLGARAGAVALTKIDLASEDQRRIVEAQLRHLLQETGLAAAPIFPISNATGEGVGLLRAHLQDCARACRRLEDRRSFRLSIDRVFTLAGRGVVVTGGALAGALRVGDEIVVGPQGLKARVRSIHAQNRAADTGHAGQRCALNLVGERIEKQALARGDMVLAPDILAPTQRIDARIRLSAQLAKPLKAWAPARLHIGAREIGAHIIPLSQDRLEAGAQGLVQLVLDGSICAHAGDALILRDSALRATIGGGRVVDAHGPPRKRRTPERLSQLAALDADAAGAMGGLLAVAPFCVDLNAFALNFGLTRGQAIELAQARSALIYGAHDARVAMAREKADELSRAILDLLAAFHEAQPDQPGLTLEKLRLQAPLRLKSPAFKAFLAILAEQGKLTLQGAWARLPGHAVRLSDEDERLWRAMAPMLANDMRFRPPRTRDIANALALDEQLARKILKRQASCGLVDEIAHDHFFLRATTAEIAEILQDIAACAPRGEITAALLRDRLNNGRKVAIQILDFFDRHGYTIRRGDLRRMNYNRLNMFAVAPAPEQE